MSTEGTAHEGSHVCVRCIRVTTNRYEECCSSHRATLCHRCYRLTHFVELCYVGCPDCEAENLPLVFPEREVEAL